MIASCSRWFTPLRANTILVLLCVGCCSARYMPVVSVVLRSALVSWTRHGKYPPSEILPIHNCPMYLSAYATWFGISMLELRLCSNAVVFRGTVSRRLHITLLCREWGCSSDVSHDFIPQNTIHSDERPSQSVSNQDGIQRDGT